MNLREKILCVGVEPAGRYAQGLKLLLVELMRGKNANLRRPPFLEIKSNGCWEWTGCESAGYGRISISERTIRAHRFFYERLVGPIEKSLVLDHVCRNKRCVNPEHLEQVTQKINTLRGVSFAAINAKKQFCPQGHPLSGENLFIRVGIGRRCKACFKKYNREYVAKKRAAFADAEKREGKG